jgi:hypothetical protein
VAHWGNLRHGEKNMTLKFPVNRFIFIARARLELQGGQNGI